MRDQYGFHEHRLGAEIFSKQTAKEAAMVGAIALAMGGVAYEHRNDDGAQQYPVPLEQHGDHNGSTHNTVPGTGTLQHKGKTMRVTQHS
jgi:hypothetical protein